MAISVVILLIMGGIAGFAAGLFGIGGGIITVPALFYFFKMLGYPPELLMKLAVGTSIASMILNAALSTWGHSRKGNLVASLSLRMIIPLITGCFIGAWIGTSAPSHLLQMGFVLFLFLEALYFYWRSRKKQRDYLGWMRSSKPRKGLWYPWLFYPLTLLIGLVANVLGIGGGGLTMPLLEQIGVSVKKAIGTSSSATLVVSVVGTLIYMIADHSLKHEIPYALGYVDLPALGALSIGSILSVSLGVKLATHISEQLLKKLFSGILILMSIALASSL